MKLFLVQHGDALAKDIDPDRPLSDRGSADVRQVASFLAPHVDAARVLHSGKTRAQQTAALLAEALPGRPSIETLAGIAPNDAVEPIASQLTDRNENCLVVGHLPFMAKLVAWLLSGSTENALVTYHPGSVVCLESDDHGGWQLQWMIRPELLTS